MGCRICDMRMQTGGAVSRCGDREPGLQPGMGLAQDRRMHRREFLWMAAVMAPMAGCVSSRAAAVRVERRPYAGWADAIWMENGAAWVVIVPSIGRVMQFGFAGRPGVFWENPKLLGKPMPADPWTAAVGSFGGDKTWPAPQSAWNWPPPDVFDQVALEARVEGNSVLLTSPVSERFGIVTERRIRLAPNTADLTIETTYRKVAGDPVEVGVWVITQLKDPERVFFRASRDPKFEGGWSRQWKAPPELVRVEEGLVSMRREPKGSYKIGNDSKEILWVGSKEVLRIAVEAGDVGTPADEGCRVELYTNGGEADYVELETLGRLSRMQVGDVQRATNRYLLGHRTSPSGALGEARLWL